MNAFKRICATLIGLVFCAAGLLKLMDPVGTGLLVETWLRFLHLGFLAGIASFLGIALSLAETLVGAALITGIARKAVACLSAAFIGAFTLLTLLLLLFKPDMDCGCFGEAIPLTAAQSLVKNLVLCLLWAVAFLPLRRLGGPTRSRYVSFLLASVSVCLFAVYALFSIPPIDFTPLHPGTELLGAYDDNFDDIVTYVYEKDGRQGSFTTDCPPDSSWTYVGTETLNRGIADPGDAPQVLSFCDVTGQYCDSLATAGPVMLLSVYAPRRLKEKHWAQLAAYATKASEMGFTPLLLLSASADELDGLVPDSALRMRSYLSDRKTLMTLNRSNGGASFVRDGQVVHKWARRSLPDEKELRRQMRRDPTEVMMIDKNESRTRVLGFCFYLAAVMFLI